ncbi:unnamed protein product [Owenia fusiformis]|uniref:Uncharacterized protein n=1 Tax=Owenia fusiformis TaxID=6347 RepID=A0A8J1Y020_OWEFU|nr:unnamed protein product [Owenia fusiformis]
MALYNYSASLPREAYVNDPEGLEQALNDRKAHGKDHYTLARGLQLVAEKGYLECVLVFLRAGALPDAHDRSGQTPLILASMQGYADIVEILIRKGCNVNKMCHRTRATALHWASANGHLECAELLLDAGANREAKTTNGRTPLMMASRNDHDLILEMLIKNNCDVNVLDVESNSALHLAAIDGAYDTTNLLIKHGCKVDQPNHYGDTPFLLAARGGHIQVVKRLLRAGCDINRRGRYTLNALHWACDKGATEVASLLLSNMISPNCETKDEIYSGDIAMERGMTPTMLACQKGHHKILKLLIEVNANIHTCQNGHFSALHFACKHGHTECVRILLNKGVIPEPLGARYDSNPGIIIYEPTPLFIAVKYNHPEVLGLILQTGVNPDIYCYHDRTGKAMSALYLASSQGRVNAILKLVKAGADITVLLKDSSISSSLLQDAEFTSWLEEWRHSPMSLKFQSRVQIRRTLGYFPNNKIEMFPLPDSMKKYLQLAELTED